MKTTSLKLAFGGLMVATVLFATSCEKKENTPPQPPVNQGGTEPPIELDCHFFNNNANAVLEDNPNAPIDYIIKCTSMNIPDDVTIKPGVTIAFDTDAGFWVREEGSLNAVGTSDRPITFTGVNKEKGSWGGIFFASNDPKNEMRHTVIEYAGGTPVSWATNEVGGVVIGVEASLKFKNNLVQHCKNWGFSLYYNANGATTIIEDNIFNQNEKPIQVALPFIGLVKGNNKYTNNNSNKVEINCGYPIEGTQTMHKQPVPYLVRGLSDFRIGEEGHLTIEPGTIIEMETDKRWEVWGSLKAVGTSSEKIIFRGATAAAGSWGNIVYYSSSPNNQLSYVEIRHAGATPNGYHMNRGAVSLAANSRLSIDYTHFEDIFSCIAYKVNPSTLTWGSSITSSNVNVANLDDCAF